VTLAFIFIIYNSMLLLARSYKTVTEHVEEDCCASGQGPYVAIGDADMH
jgi:hypothetical protein